MLLNSKKSEVRPSVASTGTSAPIATSASIPKTGKEPGFVTIGEGTRITGVIDECITLDVHGILEGDAVADVVIIRNGGGIRGNIQARNAEIYGTLEGTLSVAELLEIKSTGNVSGGMTYGSFAVEKGAQFTGAVQCEQIVPPDALAANEDVKSVTHASEEDPKIIETYQVVTTNDVSTIQ